jgi:protein gp37
MASTKIEWADKVWNPVTGCSPISEGCKNCYAERMAKRLAGRFGYHKENPFAVTLHPERLHDPLRWKKSQRIFCVSMGDLFHENVPDWALDRIMDWIFYDGISHHTFIVLTKRPKRMELFIRSLIASPPSNLILMVTAENQRRADERIPILLQTPAVVRGVSIEPCLGPVNVLPYLFTIGSLEDRRIPDEPGLDWVILGAETGPHKRRMNLDDARHVRDDCVAAGIPFFFKQDSDGNETLDGETWHQFPK